MVLPHIQDIKMLCSLLRVSRTVRRVVQRTRTSGVIGRHEPGQPVLGMQQYAGFNSFCAWLPQHAGLVSSLTVSPRETTEGDRQAMMQKLQRALQASTARTPGQAAPPPLRLQEFIASGISVSPAVLSALAPTQLQRVILHFKQPSDELSPAACAALGTLRSLRELVISYDPLFLNSGQAFLPFKELAAGIGKLTRLTKLTLPHEDPAGLEQLPPSLRSLTLNLHPVADAPAGLHLAAQLMPLDVEAAVAAALADPQAFNLNMQAAAAAALADPQFLALDVQAAVAVAPLLAHVVLAEWQQAVAAALLHVQFLPVDWQAAVAAVPAEAHMLALDVQAAFAAAPAGVQLLPPDWQAAAGIAPDDMQEPGAGQALDLQHLTALQMLSIQPLKHSVGVVPMKLPGQLRSLQVCDGDVRLLGPHMPQHVELSFSNTSHLHILQGLSTQQRQPWSLELRCAQQTALEVLGLRRVQLWRPAPA